jgi:uncharacterized protein YjbI with pentapeptide repeats
MVLVPIAVGGMSHSRLDQEVASSIDTGAVRMLAVTFLQNKLRERRRHAVERTHSSLDRTEGPGRWLVADLYPTLCAKIIGMTDAGNDDIERWVDRLSKSVERGDPVDLAAGLASDSDERNPATADRWGNGRHIPAEALRALLIKRGLNVDPRGVRIRGARITGRFDLRNVKFEHALNLFSCRVDEHINLIGARFKELKLTGSHISSVTLDQASIAGSVFADGGFVATGEVRAIEAKIGGQLGLSGATFSNAGGKALILDLASIAGGVFARDGFVATGEVRFNGARIGGQLDLSGAKFTNPDGVALNLDQASIAGSVLAGAGFVATGEVLALGATIEGQLALSGATFTHPGGVALMLDHASIAGSVFAREGLVATGEVRFNGARIGGLLGLSGATFTNPDGVALNLDHASIAGSFEGEGSVATGEVRFNGARIGGQLDLSGATFTNPDGVALNLDHASIAGSFEGVGFVATGRALAVWAHIGAQLDLGGATFTNPDGVALNLDHTSIAGSLLVDEGFDATGEVRANGATIGGQLDLVGATFTNPGRTALSLAVTTVAVLLLTPERVEGTINLTGATIADLVTPRNRHPDVRLIATGWQIGDVHGRIRHDHAAAAKWLQNTPRDRFTAQPWLALAAVYDRNGQPADARRLRFAAANQTTQFAPWYSKPFRWIYLAFAGHGYYPLFAVVWLVAALLVGLVVVATSREYVVPTNPAGAAEAAAAYATTSGTIGPVRVTADVPCERYPSYPCFDSWTYTLAGVVPAATGVTRPDWTISPAAPRYLTTALPLLRILAWICTAILLAGVTGLLRKT